MQKVSVIGVDPASIPAEQFSPECLPSVEVLDLLSYLVLETSFYTNKQLKTFESPEAFNQMVSGFVTSVVGKVIAGKYVVKARLYYCNATLTIYSKKLKGVITKSELFMGT